jgi:hypothetical protein
VTSEEPPGLAAYETALPPDLGLPGESGGGWRRVVVWVVGVLLVLDTGFLLFALSFSNITTEGPAKRALRFSTAVLTEVDAYLDDHYDALREAAAQQPDRPVSLPDFPIEITFTPEEVEQLDREEFRALLLDRAANRVYETGPSAFEDESDTELSFFSPQGAVESEMDLLREDPHAGFAVLTVVLAGIAGVLALGLLLAARGFSGLAGLGIAVLLGSAPFLILAIAVRYAFRVASDGMGDSFGQGFFELGQELTWAAIRNGIVFTVGGGVMIVLGAVLARWGRLWGRPQATA